MLNDANALEISTHHIIKIRPRKFLSWVGDTDNDTLVLYNPT